MAQDFAKKRQPKSPGASRSKKKTSEDNSSNSHWNWFFTGIITGVFGAFIGLLVIQKSSNSIQPDLSDGEVAVAQDDKDDGPVFDFYRYLPQAEVEVDVVPVEIIAEEDEPVLQYLLQAGSFQDRNDAENRLAKIILMNLDARIVPAIVSGKTWHRVQVGPFTGHRVVEDARDKLSLNNIDSIVLQLR